MLLALDHQHITRSSEIPSSCIRFFFLHRRLSEGPVRSGSLSLGTMD